MRRLAFGAECGAPAEMGRIPADSVSWIGVQAVQIPGKPGPCPVCATSAVPPRSEEGASFGSYGPLRRMCAGACSYKQPSRIGPFGALGTYSPTARAQHNRR